MCCPCNYCNSDSLPYSGLIAQWHHMASWSRHEPIGMRWIVLALPCDIVISWLSHSNIRDCPSTTSWSQSWTTHPLFWDSYMLTVFKLACGSFTKIITHTYVLTVKKFKMHATCKGKYIFHKYLAPLQYSLHLSFTPPQYLGNIHSGNANSLCVGGPTLHLAPHPNTSGNGLCVL